MRPNPNAARLLQSFMFSVECQQLMVDWGGLRSFHDQVKDKAGRKPLQDIKLMKDDPLPWKKRPIGSRPSIRNTSRFEAPGLAALVPLAGTFARLRRRPLQGQMGLNTKGPGRARAAWCRDRPQTARAALRGEC
jgi:hypothetical protein